MSDTAILVVDMMNSYRHPDAEHLIPNVEKIIDPLAELLQRTRKADDVDVIYVNDNYGDFTAGFNDLVRAACQGERPDLVDPIVPTQHCRALTKVRHSAFYASPVAYLLRRLGTERLILTGQVTEQCILYSALDAYVRHFPVVIPTDAVAGIDAELSDAALTMMQRNMGAELTTAADCLGWIRILEEVTAGRAEAPELVAALSGRRIAVLTGAGMSTDSGIPDYRGPDSPPSNPMTIRQFTCDPVFRQRYWARNHVGWRHMDDTRPNAGHRALAALENSGVVNGVITQNVDLLHTKAGSRNVINLHGTYAQIVCLSCGLTMSRAALAEQLDALNPGFTERIEAVGGLSVAPDADAVVTDTATFRYLDCPSCGGMLKPDIVYFGESVAKDVVGQAFSLVEDADALLVAGSSLTVFSGYRFVRHAAGLGMPVVIINRGSTRGDHLAGVKVEGGCSELLTLLSEELSPTAVS